MQNLNLCKTHRFIELLVKITYAYLYCWFSHDVTKIQTEKNIDPAGILLSRCIRAAEN